MSKLNRIQWRMLVLGAVAFALQAHAGPVEDGSAAIERGDFVTARQLWLSAAGAGDPAAARLLGDMYENGRGVPVDRNEASKWYFKAAEQGDVLAKARSRALADEAFEAMIGAHAGNSTTAPEDDQARFDRDLATIRAQFGAYRTCTVQEARRLEVSGERADLVVLAAARACDQRGDSSAVPGIMKNDARQDAMLAVMEARAERASPNEKQNIH